MDQSAAQQELAVLIVDALELEDVDPAEIKPEAHLFGDEEDGLGLDSIDALEIALAVTQKYGVDINADDERNREIFATLSALCTFIESSRAA